MAEQDLLQLTGKWRGSMSTLLFVCVIRIVYAYTPSLLLCSPTPLQCPSESDTTNVNGTQALLWYTMAAKMGSEYAVMRIKQLKYAWHMHAHMMHYDPDAFCRLEDPNAIASVAHVVRDYTGDCQCRYVAQLFSTFHFVLCTCDLMHF